MSLRKGMGSMGPDGKYIYTETPGAAPRLLAADIKPAPGGSVAQFHSNRDDPNWDLARRKRAVPAVHRAKLAMAAQRAAKKQGQKISFAPSTFQNQYSQYLGKRDDGELSEAEHAQRVAAAKARWEGHTKAADTGKPERIAPGAPRLKQASWHGQYRANPDDPEWKGKKDTGPDTETTFKVMTRKVQVPKGMSNAQWQELGTFAWKRTGEERKHIMETATNRKDRRGRPMIPPGTDAETLRTAFNHARNIAIHDVGPYAYDFRMGEAAKAKLKPLEPFMRYARRRMGDVLRAERKGEWAPFRREFGKPFKVAGGKVYAHDSAGHKAGDEKKRFYRHDALVKRWY